ncbi:DUF4333 domain-containing protein [Nocardia flavorosea]|uniref:DUF4333 domain-containing protein n=1 Tax=Nocardia flavorosea TaxID=53429 RepID=UPI0024564E65|nr:DUF4333 domain-containing protein [Nocardia flavorosea]
MRIAPLPVSMALGAVLLLSACTLSMMGTAECFGRFDLERAVEHILAEQEGWGFFLAQCPGVLQIRVGAETRCEVRRGDGSVTEVTVVVIQAAQDRGRIAVQSHAAQPR